MLDEPTPAASLSLVAPRLNANSLGALRALDPAGGTAFVRRVLETYLRSLDKHLDSLREARARADLAALRAVAHTLKSSSNSVGALEFAASSAELESVLRERLDQTVACRADPLAGLADLLTTYANQAEAVRLAVTAELDGVAP